MQMFIKITIGILILIGLFNGMLWFESKHMKESQDNQLEPEEIVDAGLLLARMGIDFTLYSKADTKNYEIHLQNNIRSLRNLIIQIYEAHNLSIELPLIDERETKGDKKQPRDQVITTVNKLLSEFSRLQDLSQLNAMIYFERRSIKQLHDEVIAKTKELSVCQEQLHDSNSHDLICDEKSNNLLFCVILFGKGIIIISCLTFCCYIYYSTKKEKRTFIFWKKWLQYADAVNQKSTVTNSRTWFLNELTT